MAHKLRRMNFEKLIATGENPKGFTVQTANGTGHATGTGYNREDRTYDWPQAEPGGPWPAGRSNRTAE